MSTDNEVKSEVEIKVTGKMTMDELKELLKIAGK
jgi:hypothetical protein